MKGLDYVVLAQTYLDALNSGACPTIQDAWSSVRENQFRNGIDRGQKAYAREMKNACAKYMPMEPEALREAHKKAKTHALQLFMQSVLGHEGREDAQTKLKEQIRQIFEQHRERNQEEAEIQAKDLINELYREHVIAKTYESVEDFFGDWRTVQQKYFSAVGPSLKFEVWTQFASDKIAEGCVRIARNKDMKRDLEKKQLELETIRLGKLLEMKDDSSADKAKDYEELREKLVSS